MSPRAPDGQSRQRDDWTSLYAPDLAAAAIAKLEANAGLSPVAAEHLCQTLKQRECDDEADKEPAPTADCHNRDGALILALVAHGSDPIWRWGTACGQISEYHAVRWQARLRLSSRNPVHASRSLRRVALANFPRSGQFGTSPSAWLQWRRAMGPSASAPPSARGAAAHR